ncbi:hypothetical protein J6590_078340 [Homalodisca vitripennis]|nr:hypothetical protein J6590_078340 [Homalodisca vitripennis]
MVGGIVGHSMCTGVAVLGGRFVAQRISVRTGKTVTRHTNSHLQSDGGSYCGILHVYKCSCALWMLHRPEDISQNRGYQSEQVRLLLDILILIYKVMVGGTVGYSMCTSVAVLCGCFIVQRISVRTGKTVTRHSNSHLQSDGGRYCGILHVYKCSCALWMLHRPEDISQNRSVGSQNANQHNQRPTPELETPILNTSTV